LSLLFIDVVGSTEMSVRMDPEDYRQTMFQYQSKCEEILESRGGHLARKFGDGILAYFGFPQSRENDTRRAAEAALEIIAQVSTLSAEDGKPLQVRIGLATGLALRLKGCLSLCALGHCWGSPSATMDCQLDFDRTPVPFSIDCPRLRTSNMPGMRH